ncbi:MAG TPA: hypothetical protein VKZ59_10750, partial [Acidobacteriota bacterium]|nr:hypothetical protein [Acidobacteriota bacterium]
AIDLMDQIVVTGKTSSDFPVMNAAQPERGGQSDAFVSKLNSSGSSLFFSTYLGGSGSENIIGKHDISTDPMGNICVVGRTDSSDFPLQGALQEEIGGDDDAFVVKYSPNGTLIYSTFLGGSQDDEGRGVVADEEGHCIVVGTTRSPDFPTLAAFQQQFGGGVPIGDAFVSKIEPTGEAFVFSTYLGGQLGDVANDVALDELGQPVVVGNGASNFPVSNPLLAFEGIDNYVAKFSADGSELLYSTPIGGGDQDVVVATSGRGALVAGRISAGNAPILRALQPRSNGSTEVFLVHIAEGGTLYFAQFANGTGAVSDILLTGSSPVTGSTANIIFRDNNGETTHPNVSVVGGTVVEDGEEGLVVEVPPLGLARITSDGQGLLGAGSVNVDYDNPLGGTIRFTLTPFGTTGVGESEPVRGFITPVRRTAINTGVAIYNTEDRQIGLTMRLRNMAGEEVAGGLKTTALVAHGHLAQFIHEIFTNADLENFEGTLTVETNTLNALIAATALELGSQPGQFTTLPITPLP